MRIDSILHLNIEDKDGSDIKRLTDSLTYANPKYHAAKRLGFSTYGIPQTIKNYEIFEQGRYLVTTRGEYGKVKAIFPTERVEPVRKHSSPTTGTITYHNEDFELDDRQVRAVEAIVRKKQGIIHAATSAGKSAIILKAISALNLPTLVIVHRKILLEQLLEDSRKWLSSSDGEPGVIGAGQCRIKNVTFAIDKSAANLLRRDRRALDSFGCIMHDETHLGATTTFQNIINKLPAERRYGFTGTLKRKDGMEFMIHATFGSVIATITKDELLEANRVSPVEVKIVESDSEVNPMFFELPTTKQWQMIDKSLHENVDREYQIAQKAVEIIREHHERRVVILSRYVEPCYRVGKIISSMLNTEPLYVTGKEPDPKMMCTKFEAGWSRFLCATIGCFSTGVNIPNLTDIILISPIFNNELLIHQIRGRLMRKAEGKTHGTLHFVWDPYVFEPHQLARFKSIMRK